MPGNPLRKAIGTNSEMFHEEPHQILIRRVLSSKGRSYQVHSNSDNNCHSLLDPESHSPFSESAESFPTHHSSVRLRGRSKSAVLRPASLDLSHFHQIITPHFIDDHAAFSDEEEIPPTAQVKKNNLSVYNPEIVNRGGSLRFKKGRKKKAIRRSLVRSATIVGETIKAPIGEYLKESWETFCAKMTERQTELRKLFFDLHQLLLDKVLFYKLTHYVCFSSKISCERLSLSSC